MENFLRWALDRLRGVIPFDSAMWGSGSESPQSINFNSVYLYNQPRTLIDEYVQGAGQPNDFLRAACVAHPSVTVNRSDLIRRSEWHRTPLYCEFTRKYAVERILCTAQIEPVSSLNAFISLRRSNTKKLSPRPSVGTSNF